MPYEFNPLLAAGLDKTGAAGPPGPPAEAFKTIIAGNDTIVAEQADDTLTLTAGANVTITGTAGTDTITIAAAGGGGDTVSIGASAADVLGANAGEITADDAGSDKLVFWDDSESKLTHLSVGTGLSISGTEITATAGGGATTLDGLTDVVITSATNGQVLKYDSVSSAWLNDTIAGGGGVTSVTGTAPIASSGGATPAISLNDTAVTPGAYTNASLTVDAKGRLTAASSGTAPVTSVSATAPITSSGGATPTISTSMATNKLLGRGTAGTGVAEEITLGTNLSLTGTTLNATGGGASTLDDLTDVVITSATNGQALKYNGTNWVNDTIAGGGGTPGGTASPAGQLQFYDTGGTFGGDADLTWNKTTNVLTAAGDISLNDGGTFTTTLQTVTATANRVISIPDATGTAALVAGSSGQLVYNNAGAQAGAPGSVVSATGDITLGSRFISSLNGALSATGIAGVPIAATGTWIDAGGTTTTTKPQVLIEPTGTTSTGWSTAGTGLGINQTTTFTGNILDLQRGGASLLSVKLINSGGTYAQISAGGTASGALNFTAGSSVLIGGTGVGGWKLGSGNLFGWSSQAGGGAVYDLSVARDAANALAQRNAANAQAFRVYDTYTSATDYHRIAIATARATLSAVSGASVTATALIPAGAVVMGVTSKVTTGLGTSNGTTGYKIGTGADDDRWGAITDTAAGTTSDNRNWTAGTIECFPTATDVIVTATGGNFDATGVIYLSVQYMTGQAD